MKLENIFDESKILLDDNYLEGRQPGFTLVDEFDENGDLITVVKHDYDNNIAVHIQDVENDRHNYSTMPLNQYMKLDFGNFKRLINELFYYAQ